MTERSDQVYHADLVSKFESAEDASYSSRRKAERDVDYYDGKQWTEEEVKTLKRRGQPAITWNRIAEKVDYLQGWERTQRTKPRALPRTPVHQQESFAATDALQFVCEDNRYDDLRSAVWGDLLKVGWGGEEITVEPKTNMMGSTAMTGPTYRVVIRRCAWDRMFWDPYSSEPDFSDASYLGLVLWMDREEAIRRYGEAAAAVFDETVKIGSVGGTYDDKPKMQSWVSGGDRRRVRVVQMYFIADDGQWDFCEFTKGGILKDGPSPWLDEDGKREHPYSWRSAYVDRDNNRYGVIRGMIDLQDEINKRRSKALHHFTSRQTFGNQKYAANAAENKKQLARPDGHVNLVGEAEFNKDFGVIPTNDQASGHFELLQQATAAFETMGPNAAMMGKKGQSESGRAILAQQQGGTIQLGTVADTLKQMDFETYRKAWMRIRQFWTGETWIRVTDDERNMRFVALNKPVMDEFGQAQMQNPIADLDVDIIIDDAPGGGVLMDEQWQGLVGLGQAGVQFPPEVYIEAMPNLRNKDKLLEILAQEKQKPPNPLQVAGAQAEVAEKAASAKDKAASADLKQAKTIEAMASARQKGAETQDQHVQTGLDLAAALNPQPVAQPNY